MRCWRRSKEKGWGDSASFILFGLSRGLLRCRALRDSQVITAAPAACHRGAGRGGVAAWYPYSATYRVSDGEAIDCGSAGETLPTLEVMKLYLAAKHRGRLLLRGG
jgi:hypothetical protein